MIPGTHDFTVVRGTTSPFIVQLQAPEDLNYDPPVFIPIPFTDVHLTIAPGGGGTIYRKKLSDNDVRFFVSNEYEGEITWLPTPDETRQLAESKNGAAGKNHYELEIWNGTEQEVFLIGTITAIGGINDDV
jgi:hypothetical protein